MVSKDLEDSSEMYNMGSHSGTVYEYIIKENDGKPSYKGVEKMIH